MGKKLGVVMLGWQVSGRLERVEMKVIRMHYMHLYNCHKNKCNFSKTYKISHWDQCYNEIEQIQVCDMWINVS